MVIMLDHITIAVSRAMLAQMREGFPNYRERFSEWGLRNIEAKKPFFQAPQVDHDLLKLEQEQGFPLELVAYETCTGISGVEMEPDLFTVHWPTWDAGASLLFWKTIGFKQTGPDTLALRGPLDKRALYLTLREAPERPAHYLDQTGVAAIAFVVKGFDRIREKIVQAGFFCPPGELLCVNGKTRKIGFAQGKCGELVELVSIER